MKTVTTKDVVNKTIIDRQSADVIMGNPMNAVLWIVRNQHERGVQARRGRSPWSRRDVARKAHAGLTGGNSLGGTNEGARSGRGDLPMSTTANLESFKGGECSQERRTDRAPALFESWWFYGGLGF
jgi:hypothetical protein